MIIECGRAGVLQRKFPPGGSRGIFPFPSRRSPIIVEKKGFSVGMWLDTPEVRGGGTSEKKKVSEKLPSSHMKHASATIYL